MADAPQTPTGPTRRRRRLSDEETGRRMLDAALAMVNRTGLTVSLDHLSLEDVIREAGVSRSAVYRRWPYKDLFFSDLLRELARAVTPAAITNAETAVPLVRRVTEEHPGWLATPELRQALVTELLRTADDFETTHSSTEWRTYLALHATFLSLPDSELRDDVQAILVESERGFVGRIATAHRQLTGLLGYRLRAELGLTYETIASLLGAALRGLVVMAPAIPELATHRVRARPFGVQAEAEWSLPSLGLASMTLSFIEPDPDVTWDEARIERVREQLVSGAWLRDSAEGGQAGDGLAQ